jgi:biopolymer transport protein ExbD
VLTEPFVKLFSEGGWVLYPIFGVSVMVLHIAIGKLTGIRRLNRARRRAMAALLDPATAGAAPPAGHAAFDAWVQRLRRPSPAVVHIERACADLHAEIVPLSRRGLSTISAGIMMAPLLGLLGTISGMNEMFSVIGEFGFGNPTIMANGISMALQATLTGLAVAVASLFFLDRISNAQQQLLAALREDRDVLLQKATASAGPRGSAPDGGPMNQHLGQLSDDRQNPEINLAPFVDTIMILLIFFVVTANLYVETGVNVSRPKAQSAAPAGQKAMLIGITREGTIHIYGRQTSIERLRTIVEQELGKQPDLSVVIIADRDGPVGRTVEVIDQCTLAGVQKVSIAANKDR